MIVELDSGEDPAVEPFRHVGDARWLSGHGLFVAEGRLLVERLLASRFAPLHSVLVSPAAHAALATVLKRIEEPVFVAPQDVLNSIAGFNFHRGCLALARRPAAEDLARVGAAALILALEAVGNPDNVGGLFRAAAAFGAGGVLLDVRAGDPLYRKALRTSMGAVFSVPFARVRSASSAARELGASGCAVIALTPNRSAPPLDEALAAVPPGSRLAFFVGSEGSGLSQDVMSAAAPARIPIEPHVESLNVVVAAAIALSQARTRGS